MDPLRHYAIDRLAAGADAIEALARGVAGDQARWRPAPDAWSLLEVVCHLGDEEDEDFRTRTDYLLHRPGEPFPAIDPQGWVAGRGYNDRDPAAALARFLAERRQSLDWLAALDGPDWESGTDHPVAGRITAGGMLAAWVAHDMLHIRQLNELHWQHMATWAPRMAQDYAGGW